MIFSHAYIYLSLYIFVYKKVSFLFKKLEADSFFFFF